MRNQIIYSKWTFSDDDVREGNCYLETAIPSTSLAYNTLEVTVRCPDKTIVDFTQDTPMTYFYRERKVSIFYVQSVKRTGPDRYTITGVSAVGRLSQLSHAGGVYDGETVEDVVLDICGPVPVIVKSILKNIRLYGWLSYAKPPNQSARDNLSQVLFAIGASLGTDLDGNLRVEPLFDGVSNIVSNDRMYQGGNVEYGTPVSAVTVAEHQYVPGGDVETLFEGTSAAGDIITFNAPHYGLSASGFSILERGANYAKLSAGSGTLTGMAYIHTTRQVTETVTPGAADNVKSITDATLVSLTNSVAVARRMADYYRCAATIKAPVSIKTERPGQLVSVYHPYDKEMVSGCVAKEDVTISGTLKANTEVLVGYVPTQPTASEVFDSAVVLTESGTFTVPEGVTVLTVVCIGGGQSGQSGGRGASGGSPPTLDTNISGEGRFKGYDMGEGGAGGVRGGPGQGGNIIQETIDVKPGQKITYTIGKGGVGTANSSSTSPITGNAGGATIFGTVSSANGGPNPNGYTDPLTGEVYAKPGTGYGIAGGAGSGNSGRGPSISYNGTTYTAGVRGGAGATHYEYISSAGTSVLIAQGGQGSGGGAAAGGNGSAGTNGTVSTYITVKTTGGTGGRGGNAAKPAKQTQRGWGGNGGNGGGGGGGAGLSAVNTTYESTYSTTPGTPGSGGSGSAGGDGGDGVIIIYYSGSREIDPGAGQIVTKDFRFTFDRLGRLLVV